MVASDIATIRDRYVRSVLPSAPAQIKRLRALSSQYANALLSDGLWPEVQYQSNIPSTWSTAEHLNRTLIMAKMACLLRIKGEPDTALEAKAILALKAWTDHDYHNPNWWWNEIGVPELTGEIATLLLPKLPKSDLAGVLEIMKRSNWRRVPWTGANLIWGVEIEIVRGCLENDAQSVVEGYNRMYQEIKVVGHAEEGIQQDDSFHQHGVQFYNGGYGLFYANDVGRFIAFAWGTRFQIPADKMAIFSAYLLDGEQWMVRGDVFDYSAIGREITRKELVALPADWTVGPVSTSGSAGPAYSLGNIIAMLAADPSSRQREFKDFAARLRGQANAPAFVGNKQFWCSDFMAHRRKSFYTSVKMLSNRMQNAEVTIGEGKKSEHLSDGVNFLYLTGDEYKDIFPVMDWTKLPGTTAIQGTLDTSEKNPISTRGSTSFDGGVSDGMYGAAAMDLSRGKLAAKKAWFFFDDSYLCLGAGITLREDLEHAVATDVNQTLLHGAVFTSQSKRPVDDGAYTYITSGTSWIFHDHVGYIFLPGTHVELSVGTQTGRWSDIGAGSSDPVTEQVFNLWIDHGRSPKGESYQYIVFPSTSVEETKKRADHPQVKVLANDERIQAAWNGKSRVAMIVFRQSGSLTTPFGRVEVDHPCLLLIRMTSQGMKISAANPLNLPLTLQVKIGARETTIDLPDGNFAGSTVTTTSSSTVRMTKQ